MKLKKVWKKANRGVLLAGILIVILACYVTVDKITFNSEKPEINQLMENYIEEYLTTLVSSEQVIQNNGVWDDAARKAQKETQTSVVSKYWTSTFYSSGRWSYQLDKSSIVDSIQLVHDDLLKNQTGFISNIEHLISKVKINKNGPNAAYYTCTLKMTMTSTGDIEYAFLNGNSINTNQNYYGESTDTMREQSTTYEFDLEVELLREKGEWKISNFEPSGWSSYSAQGEKEMEVA